MNEKLKTLSEMKLNLQIQTLLAVLVTLSPCVFLVYLNHILFNTEGTYDIRYIIDFNIIALSSFFLYSFKRALNPKITAEVNQYLTIEKVLPIIISLFVLYSFKGSRLYTINLTVPKVFYISSIFTLIACAQAFHKPNSKTLKYVLLGAIAISFLSHLTTIIKYPEPDIDIWYIFTDASDYLFEGINPYKPIYRDIYNGTYIKLYGDPKLIYWPLNLILCAVGYLAGDIRYGILFAITLTIFAIYKLLKSYNIKTNSIYLTILVFLSFSMSKWVLNMSWTETYIFPFLLLAWYFFNKKNFILMGIMIGLTACTKQSVIFYLILVFATLINKESVKSISIMVLSALSIFMIINLPFILWDPKLFYQNTVTDLVNYLPRSDSFSWAPHILMKYNIPFNQELYGVSILVVTLIFAGLLIFKKNKNNIFFFTVIVYFFVFITSKQAFCNYYYFLEFLGLFWVIESLRKNDTTPV